MIKSLFLVVCSGLVAGTHSLVAGKQRPKHLEFLPKFWRPTMKPTPVEITPPPSITIYKNPQVNQPSVNVYEAPQVNQHGPEKFPQPPFWRPITKPPIEVSLPPTPRIHYNEPLLRHSYQPLEPDYTNFRVDTDNVADVNTQIRCVSDEDCLQHPRLSAGCPNFCVDGVCGPRDDDTPPVLRFKTNMKVDHSKFKLREEEELERVFGGAALHYPKESLSGRFFEVVKGSPTVLEVKYPSDYFKVAAQQLEKLPGTVSGNQEVSAEGDHEKMDFGNEPTGPTTSSDTFYYGDSFNYGDNIGQSVQHNGPFGQHRGLAIQGDSPNRWRVRNTDSNPWRRNGRLSMGCTASLIGNRVLLTAAHCVWDKDTDSWAAFPSFAPGQDGNDKPLGEGQVVRMTIPAGYISCSNNNDCRAHDWAVLVLHSSDVFNVGYFGFSTNKGNSRLNLPGYPRSKNRQMWYDHCPVLSDEGDWIKHRCDTERGNSGSAIYKIVHGGRYVVAVHGGGHTDLWNRGADVDGQTSSAGRLYDRMLAYRREFG